MKAKRASFISAMVRRVMCAFLWMNFPSLSLFFFLFIYLSSSPLLCFLWMKHRRLICLLGLLLF